MHMRTGRQTPLSQRADDLAGDYGLATRHPDRRQVAIEDTHVNVDHNHYEIPSAIWIKTDVRDTRARGMDLSPDGSRQVDARVYVTTRTERVVWLQLKARAAKALRDDGAGDNPCQRQPLLARNLRGRDDPNHRTRANHRDHTKSDHAFAKACSMWVNAWWTVV